MRRRISYALAFLLVLAAAVAGFFWTQSKAAGLRDVQLPVPQALLQTVSEFDLSSLLPRATRAPSAQTTPTERPIPAAATAVVMAAAPPTVTVTVTVSAPVTVTVPVTGVVTVTPEATATPAPPIAAATPLPVKPPTATPVPTDTPVPAPPAPRYGFVLAGPVRHTNDACSSALIRGVVLDAGGNPVAGVRIWRYDQWGNEQVVESKNGDGDRGRYDFPIGNTANVHYVQIIDAAGVIISPVVEVQHQQGDAGAALCHEVDWRQN